MQAGWHYVDVRAMSGSGGYTLETNVGFPVPQPPDVPERIWGADRYRTAVEIAAANFPGWVNCEHIIIASGEDRAAADPLAAAGLVWTCGGPILLVSSDAVPSVVANAVRQIALVSGGVTVHVVGGPVSVPDARLTEIAAVAPGLVTIDRIAPARDRFELAATVARTMVAKRPTDHNSSSAYGRVALIANGADPDKFFDALALSPIAAKNGFPILLVNRDSVPSATRSALGDLGVGAVVVGGGPATVSDGVLAELDAGPIVAGRWAGEDRYATATQIAYFATIGGWLKPHNVSVTAKLPDALTGGAFTGLRSSPVLITQGDRLSGPPAAYLSAFTDYVGECYVLGGPVSVTESTKTQIGDALAP